MTGAVAVAGGVIGGEVGVGVFPPGGVEETAEPGVKSCVSSGTVSLQFGDLRGNQLRQIPYALEHLDLATFSEIGVVGEPTAQL